MGNPSDRVRLHRLPERGTYDIVTALDLVEKIGIGTVAYACGEMPRLTPTFLWRHGDALYWHGSAASQAIRDLSTGLTCCVSAFAIDGLVLARSGMHSSVNYRSVICYGTASPVRGDDAKLAALRGFMDRFVPGRWPELRPPTAAEVKATQVMRMTVEDASVKINASESGDPPEDVLWPAWAGVVPVDVVVGEPRDAPDLLPGIERPDYLRRIDLGG